MPEEDLHTVPIYVTGHCNPDAESIVAAITYTVQEGRTAEYNESGIQERVGIPHDPDGYGCTV